VDAKGGTNSFCTIGICYLLSSTAPLQYGRCWSRTIRLSTGARMEARRRLVRSCNSQALRGSTSLAELENGGNKIPRWYDLVSPSVPYSRARRIVSISTQCLHSSPKRVMNRHMCIRLPHQHTSFVFPVRRVFSEGCAGAVKRILGKIEGNCEPCTLRIQVPMTCADRVFSLDGFVAFGRSQKR
jgi:hypothetical protein